MWNVQIYIYKYDIKATEVLILIVPMYYIFLDNNLALTYLI